MRDCSRPGLLPDGARAEVAERAERMLPAALEASRVAACTATSRACTPAMLPRSSSLCCSWACAHQALLCLLADAWAKHHLSSNCIKKGRNNYICSSHQWLIR